MLRYFCSSLRSTDEESTTTDAAVPKNVSIEEEMFGKMVVTSIVALQSQLDSQQKQIDQLQTVRETVSHNTEALQAVGLALMVLTEKMETIAAVPAVPAVHAVHAVPAVSAVPKRTPVLPVPPVPVFAPVPALVPAPRELWSPIPYEVSQQEDEDLSEVSETAADEEVSENGSKVSVSEGASADEEVSEVSEEAADEEMTEAVSEVDIRAISAVRAVPAVRAIPTVEMPAEIDKLWTLQLLMIEDRIRHRISHIKNDTVRLDFNKDPIAREYLRDPSFRLDKQWNFLEIKERRRISQYVRWSHYSHEMRHHPFARFLLANVSKRHLAGRGTDRLISLRILTTYLIFSMGIVPEEFYRLLLVFAKWRRMEKIAEQDLIRCRKLYKFFISNVGFLPSSIKQSIGLTINQAIGPRKLFRTWLLNL